MPSKENACKLKPKVSATQIKFLEYHQRAVLLFCEHSWQSRILVFLGFTLKHSTASTPHFKVKALVLMSMHTFLHMTQQACVYSKFRDMYIRPWKLKENWFPLELMVRHLVSKYRRRLSSGLQACVLLLVRVQGNFLSQKKEQDCVGWSRYRDISAQAQW